MLNQVKFHLLIKVTGQPERMSLHQNSANKTGVLVHGWSYYGK